MGERSGQGKMDFWSTPLVFVAEKPPRNRFSRFQGNFIKLCGHEASGGGSPGAGKTRWVHVGGQWFLQHERK